MAFEYDEKGKIFTDIVTKVAVHARIQTTTHMIIGQMHVRRDQRIKDELDSSESFLALTDATILGPEGQVLFQVSFLAVQRSHIIWVMPQENHGEEKTS